MPLDVMLLVKAAVMGIVEGLTEFLPISSTGHLILAASLLDFTGERVKVFEIAIQTGAMLAVIWQYRVRLASTVVGITHDPIAQRFARNLLIAFAPAVVFGLLLGSAIKQHLFHPVPVALAFIIGGLIILLVERRHHAKYGDLDLAGKRHARVETVDDMSALDALKVGLVQCAALIPGTSRSGATIIGAMIFGLVAQGRNRVQLLPRHPDADGRRRLFGVEAARAAQHGRPADVRGRDGVCVHQRAAVHTLADPLRLDARLRAVRVVPHRVRRHRAPHRVERPGGVAGLSVSGA